jgi:hypothetical protein
MLVAVCLGSDGVGLEDALLELKWVASSFNIHVPTRNLFRHGNFNDFHLYHTCCIGVIGLDDIASSKLQVT